VAFRAGRLGANPAPAIAVARIDGVSIERELGGQESSHRSAGEAVIEGQLRGRRDIVQLLRWEWVPAMRTGDRGQKLVHGIARGVWSTPNLTLFVYGLEFVG
jgi:hypothetical protein